MVRGAGISASALSITVAVVAVLKAGYFLFENGWHLREASLHDMPYYSFLRLVAVNMAQVVVSFALDFALLDAIDPAHFSGVKPDLAGASRLFEFLYFSVLNFSFFGFGDLTPATVPAKVVTLLEVVLSFLALVFLLSDFAGMKESLRAPRRESVKK